MTPTGSETVARISVAMVTFNGERYLREQLETILTQDPPPDEIVIGDDGSEDGTVRVIREELRDTGASVRVLTGEHLGLRLNMQRTLEACTGDIIVLADQDDVWMPGKLGAIREAFADPDVSIWFSDADLIDDQGDLLHTRLWEVVALRAEDREILESGEGLRRLLYGQTVTGATMAFRSSLLGVVLPLPSRLDGDDHLYLHDGWIAVLGSLLGSMRLEPSAYTRYRQHPLQVTARQRQQLQSRPAPGVLAGRSALRDDRDRVRLVLSRIRTHDAVGRCRSHDMRLLTELDEFFSVRVMPRSPAKLRAVWGQLRLGRYSRYARGLRTAVADAFAPRRESL